jgi:hypothetical protein
MWNRQELKSNARIMLKANYLKIVIVSVVFALLTSSGYQSAKGAAKGSDADISLRHLTGIQWSLVVAAFDSGFCMESVKCRLHKVFYRLSVW